MMSDCVVSGFRVLLVPCWISARSFWYENVPFEPVTHQDVHMEPRHRRGDQRPSVCSHFDTKTTLFLRNKLKPLVLPLGNTLSLQLDFKDVSTRWVFHFYIMYGIKRSGDKSTAYRLLGLQLVPRTLSSSWDQVLWPDAASQVCSSSLKVTQTRFLCFLRRRKSLNSLEGRSTRPALLAAPLRLCSSTSARL